MKFGALATAFLILFGICLMVYAFMANATPYVSAKEAAASNGRYVHVAGTIDHNSASFDIASGVFQFDLIDDSGDRLKVVYHGAKPPNFDSAPKASVGGTGRNGQFAADSIKTQCPSKYEAADR